MCTQYISGHYLDFDSGDEHADLYEARKAKLGPDPLREDADAEVVWARVQGSRKPIGQLLMDQDAVAGLGNIYRAEVLFKVSHGPRALLGCSFRAS